MILYRSDALRTVKDDWLSFAQEIEILQSIDPANEEMVTIYHKRDSSFEALLEDVILVSQRNIKTELAHPTFSFVPTDSRRRLMKYCRIHFLGRRLCKLANLSCQGSHLYTDSLGRVAATRRKSAL